MFDIIDDCGAYRKAIVNIFLQLGGNGTVGMDANISSLSAYMTKGNTERLKIYIEGSYHTPCNVYASIRSEYNGHFYSISGIHIPEMVISPCTNATLLTSLPSGTKDATEVSNIP